jgi:hypothetical protein
VTTRQTRTKLERLRVDVCRLVSARALNTLAEAELFLIERGMLTLTADSALPSLFGATHEEPFAPGRPGFGAYPRTKWWWGAALAQLPRVVPTKLHRARSLYLPRRTAELVDPLCRRGLATAAAGELGDPARLIVDHLETAGPSLLEELKDELGLDAPTVRAARRKLEALGAVLSVGVRPATDSGSHTHSSRLTRWDQLVPASAFTAAEALAELAVAGVQAAVIANRAELARWFSWRIDARLVDELIEAGRLLAIEDALTTPSAANSV